MAEKFLISKALDLRPSALGKSMFMVIKGLLALGAIVGIGWFIYVGAIKPHTKGRLATSTTNQQAGKINNFQITLEEDNCWVSMFGCKAFCFKNQKVYNIVNQREKPEITK